MVDNFTWIIDVTDCLHILLTKSYPLSFLWEVYISWCNMRRVVINICIMILKRDVFSDFLKSGFLRVSLSFPTIITIEMMIIHNENETSAERRCDKHIRDSQEFKKTSSVKTVIRDNKMCILNGIKVCLLIYLTSQFATYHFLTHQPWHPHVRHPQIWHDVLRRQNYFSWKFSLCDSQKTGGSSSLRTKIIHEFLREIHMSHEYLNQCDVIMGYHREQSAFGG